MFGYLRVVNICLKQGVSKNTSCSVESKLASSSTLLDKYTLVRDRETVVYRPVEFF